jgi:hypothetical protein
MAEEKTKKEKAEAKATKAKAREQIITLQGRSSDDVRVENKPTVLGNEGVDVTHKSGAKAEVYLGNNGEVDVKGEDNGIKSSLESGGKITTNNSNDNSNIKRETEDYVRNSNLSEEKKAELIQGIGSTDFTKNPESLQDYANSVRQKVEAETNKKQEEQEQKDSKDPNAMETVLTKMGVMQPKEKSDGAAKPVMAAATAVVATAVAQKVAERIQSTK